MRDIVPELLGWPMMVDVIGEKFMLRIVEQLQLNGYTTYHGGQVPAGDRLVS